MKERYPPMKDIKKASKKVNKVFSEKKEQKKKYLYEQQLKRENTD